MRTWFWVTVGVAVCLSTASAEELLIESFDSSGGLAFRDIADVAAYSIEWAAQPNGEWTDFGRPDLAFIPSAGDGIVTATVPVRYRVVADVHTDYLIVDLSGGPSATNYPVSAYTEIPPGGWTDEYKTTKMAFRLIPAGAYLRGSPTNELTRISTEHQHKVIISRPFYIGVFEVTQQQWERVMGTWPSHFTNATHRATRPVERVSHADIVGQVGWWWPDTRAVGAESFMGRLATRTGMTFHLPTEGEWEYAARAGSTAALTSGLNITNQLVDANLGAIARYRETSDYANAHRDSDISQGTTTVGSYPPNNWGLYDIHGNVSELVLDTEGPYPDIGATVTDLLPIILIP